MYSYFSLIKLINNCILWCVTVCLLCSINVTIYLSISIFHNDECEPPVPKKSLLLYVELFYKKYAEKIEKNAPALRSVQKMHPHCAKCQKMWHMQKNLKSAGFLCGTQSHFSPGCDYLHSACVTTSPLKNFAARYCNYVALVLLLASMCMCVCECVCVCVCVCVCECVCVCLCVCECLCVCIYGYIYLYNICMYASIVLERQLTSRWRY